MKHIIQIGCSSQTTSEETGRRRTAESAGDHNYRLRMDSRLAVDMCHCQEICVLADHHILTRISPCDLWLFVAIPTRASVLGWMLPRFQFLLRSRGSFSTLRGLAPGDQGQDVLQIKLT